LKLERQTRVEYLLKFIQQEDKMKHGYSLLIVILTLLVLSFTACGDSSNADETDGDSNTDGDAVGDCEGDVCYLSGTYTDDITLTPDIQWVLRGGVFIGDDENETILTIEPGTTIYGETSTVGMLSIRRGSKIMAEGTKDAPIVFTSSKEEGDRSRGDWGGVIINGRAPINSCGEADETKACEALGEGGTGYYGGNDPDDNSGVLRYVRVEFAGRILSPDNELNGIAFQGVGRGTSVDFVQVHMNKDDGIEFFGGTAEVKHVLITGPADDCFDWTDGWQGKAQFVVLQQYSDAGDQGIEADNNAEDNEATPRAMPTLANFTIIGSPDSEFSDLGILLREGTGANLYNVIIQGFNEACLDIDNSATFAFSGAPGSLTGNVTMENSLASCATNYKMNDEKDENEDTITDPWSLEEWFTSQDGNQASDPMLGDPYNTTAPQFIPNSGSPALIGSILPSDSFFNQVDFIGGVDPSDDWTKGWTISAQN
jgi:hypothetical protein